MALQGCPVRGHSRAHPQQSEARRALISVFVFLSLASNKTNEGKKVSEEAA